MSEIFNLSRFGKSVALVTENEKITFERLKEESDDFAKRIGKRCLLFLLCKNEPAAIIAYIGCINNRIVPVMLDSEMDTELLARLIDIYCPEYIWQPTEVKKFANVEQVLSSRGYTLWSTKTKNAFSLYKDLALLMTTSGSTGSQKLVRLSYGNLRANTASIIEYLGINMQERAITNLPIHYVYGLSIVNTHICVGASLVVTARSIFQKEFWQLFNEKVVTSLAGVPYTFQMLERLRFFRMNLPSLHTITQAGGKLDPELHKKFAEYAQNERKRFFVMYGASEATARMGYLPHEESLRKCGSMGVAIPGGRFELIAEEGSVIEKPYVAGELVYYGANVMLGYAESREDLGKGDSLQGKLHTGDIACRDEEGFYTIVGRKKRFIKMFGKRTNLAEVEHILRQHFQLTDVACAGQDDKLYVFLTEETLVKNMALYLSAKLGFHPTSISVKYIEEIPQNTSGKILYQQLEQYYS